MLMNVILDVVYRGLIDCYRSNDLNTRHSNILARESSVSCSELTAIFVKYFSLWES